MGTSGDADVGDVVKSDGVAVVDAETGGGSVDVGHVEVDACAVSEETDSSAADLVPVGI